MVHEDSRPGSSRSNLAGDGAQEASEIRRRQWTAAHRRTPWIVVANLVSSALTAGVFWELAPHGALVGWWALVWVAALTRVHGWWHDKGRPAPDRGSRRAIAGFLTWAGVAGCIWGSAGVLFFVTDSITHQVFLAVVLGYMTAGAAVTLTVLPAAAAAYILLALLPLASALFIQASPASLAMSGMVALYSVVLLLIVRNGYAGFVNTVRSRRERDALRSEIAQAYESLDAEIVRRERVQHDLEESEARHRAILDTAADAVITIDHNGLIEHFNPTAERMFGYSAAEVSGKNIAMLMPLAHAKEHDGYLKRYLQTGEAKIIGIGREVSGKRKDGTVFPVELSVGVVRSDNQTIFTGIIRDITDRKQGEKALRASEERFRDFAESASDWFWETDSDNRFRYISERFFEITGTKAEFAIGKTPLDLVDRDAIKTDLERWYRHQEDISRHRPIRAFDFPLRGSDGKRFYVSVSGRPVFDGRGEFRGYRGTGRDITEIKRAEEEIKKLANHDALTGLPSLRLGKDRLTTALAAARRRKTSVALMFLDLDGFKTVNDTLGHEAGNVVLEKVAKRLLSCVRETDTVARIGGDEFIIVLTDVSHSQAALDVAGIVINSLSQPIRYRNEFTTIGVSVGIAIYPEHGKTADDLIRRADKAMYEVKYRGKNDCQMAHAADTHDSSRNGGDVAQTTDHDRGSLIDGPCAAAETKNG